MKPEPPIPAERLAAIARIEVFLGQTCVDWGTVLAQRERDRWMG